MVVNLFIPAKATGKVTGLLAQSCIKSTSLFGPLKGKQMPDSISLTKNGQAYVNVRTAQNPREECYFQVLQRNLISFLSSPCLPFYVLVQIL